MSDLQRELGDTIYDYAFMRELGWSRTDVIVLADRSGIFVTGLCRLCEPIIARGVHPGGSTWSHAAPEVTDAFAKQLKLPHETTPDEVFAAMRANCRHECPRGHAGGKLSRIRLDDCADLNSDETTARVLAQAGSGEAIFDRQHHSDTVAMFWVGVPREGWTG
jgi:hypothetical protein